MLSSFELNFDLNEEVNATNYEKTSLDEESNIKVYIPTLMANIPHGDKPQISNLSTDGKDVFKNGSKKPALTGYILKELNYMEAKYNTEIASTDISSATAELTEYIKNNIDPSVHSINTKKYSYTIPEKSHLRVQFLNGKLSKLSYYITNDSNAEKSLT